MNDILDEIEEPLSFTDEEILTEIWTRPREVFRYIHERQYEKYMLVLLMIAGIYKTFDRASSQNLGDTLPLLGVITVCVLSGIMFGWLSAYISAALISWTGVWLDGEADTKSILRIIAYASIPSIIALFLIIPQMGIYGVEIFKEEGDVTSGGMMANIIYWGSMILELVLGICSIFFYVIGVSEVQGFEIWKAVVNLILAMLVIIVPVVLLVLIIT